MSDLVAFLRARLDEEEAVARAAEDWAPSPWRWVDPGGSVKQALVDSDGLRAEGSPRVAGSEDVDVLAHAALWDPARVLAEIKAKREIIDALGVSLALVDHPDNEGGYYVGLEYAVRVLAQSYADHLDFDPTWRMA